MTGYSKWTTAAVCIVLIAVCGCEKKDDHAPQKQQNQLKRIDEHAISQQVVNAFPMIRKYLYPFGEILSASSVPNEEEDFQIRLKLPDIVKVEYSIETTDDVETLYAYYSKLFDEDVIRRYYAQDKLQTIAATDIFREGGYKELPYEVQLKVSHPGRNFTDEVRLSQIEAINKQVAQYEKIIDMQKRRLADVEDPNDISSIQEGVAQSEKRIDDLKIQSALLTRQTTLVYLSVKYLYVKPVEKIMDKKFPTAP